MMHLMLISLILSLIRLDFSNGAGILESLIIQILSILKIYSIFNSYNRFKDYKSVYFDIILINKDLPANSLNLIKTFQTDSRTCVFECNQNISCNIAIYNTNGLCTLCKKPCKSELVNCAAGEYTAVYQCDK